MPRKNTTVRKIKETKNKIIIDQQTTETKSEITCDRQIENNNIFDEMFDPILSSDSNWTMCTEHLMMRYDQKLLQNIEISGIDQIYKQVCEDRTIQIPETKKQDVDSWIVYRLYRVCDNLGNHMISYTTQTMECSVLRDLISLKSGKKGKLEKYKNNLEKVRYQLLDCYKCKEPCISTMKRIKNQYIKNENKNIESESKNQITVWETYKTFYKDAVTDEIKNILPPKTYYIYRVYKIHDTKEQCIIGSYELITKTNIDKICKANNIYFSPGTKIFDLLHTNECHLDCERSLDIDQSIYQYDTMNFGLNFCYQIVKSIYVDHRNTDKSQIRLNMHMDMHMDVQKHIMLQTYDRHV